jgi:chorismate synthase
MDSKDIDAEKIIVPRPGHADLNGALKYNFDDLRNVIERASARETAIRVAIGAISMELLRIFNVKIVSRVKRIGNTDDKTIIDLSNDDTIDKIENSPVRCYDSISEAKMIEEIDTANSNGDTLGGEVEVSAFGVPCGLGSYVSYDRRMDYNISGALMSIQGVKAVEFGEGIHASCSTGSKVNDEIVFKNGYYSRRTNYSGGIEGGITSGMPIAVRIFMKPIPTIRREIKTADLKGRNVTSRYERSDTCAVPTLGVICENVLAYEIAKAFLEKFPGDSIEEIKNSYDFYIGRIARG